MEQTSSNQAPCSRSRTLQELPEVQLFPMPCLCNVSCNGLLTNFHEAQHKYPVRDLWGPTVRLPQKLLEYMSAVLAEYPAQIRQESILLLKRFVWLKRDAAMKSRLLPNLQVVALTCVNLAIKHWQSHSLPEQKLHWLSRNAFTKQDFIDAEGAVMVALDCSVHWEGVLLAEWHALLLFLVGGLFEDKEDSLKISGVADHIADVLVFQDELMAAHLPCELAAATLHAAVTICTKRLQRHSILLRISHLCHVTEEQVVRLSEEILGLAIGSRSTELLLEGSGVTAEDSELDEDNPGSSQSPF